MPVVKLEKNAYYDSKYYGTKLNEIKIQSTCMKNDIKMWQNVLFQEKLLQDKVNDTGWHFKCPWMV